MRARPCPTCGRPADPTQRCPHCGAPADPVADELARIEADIAEMAARDVAMENERTQLSKQMQAAMHRRALLANTQEERARPGVSRPKRTGRNRPPRMPPTQRRPTPTPPVPPQPGPDPDPLREAVAQHPPGAGARAATVAGGGPTVGAGGTGGGRGAGGSGSGAGAAAGGAGSTGGQRRPTAGPDGRPSAQPPEPEASTRSVQNVLLALGALLLGVAATVFAGLAISTLDSFLRAGILAAVTVLTLIAPIPVRRRGLVSTAETIAAIGLLMVPLVGYALWTVEQARPDRFPGAVYAGLVFAATTVVAFRYAAATGLSVPRYAAVLAVQPVVPLLAYPWLSGPTGWALALSGVALVDLLVARLLVTRLAAWAGVPTVEKPVPARRSAGERPEGAPEEPEAVVTPAGDPADRAGDGPDGGRRGPLAFGRRGLGRFGRRGRGGAGLPAAAPTGPFWLRDVAWTLHGLAYAAALGFAGVALATVDTVAGATAAGTAILLAAVIGVLGLGRVSRPRLARPAADGTPPDHTASGPGGTAGPATSWLTQARHALPQVTSGALTIAVVAAVGRVAAAAMPGRAMLVIAAVVAVVGLGVRLAPTAVRQGAEIASAVTLAVIGVVVGASAIGAAVAPVRAATPYWSADLDRYDSVLAEAVSPVGWQLVVSALLLTLAAALALPADIRRQATIAGAALTVLAAPASLGLPWWVTPWVLLTGGVAICAAGLSSRHVRSARAHLIGGGVTVAFAAGAGATRPGVTAGVLAGITLAGVLLAAAGRFAQVLAAPDRASAHEIGTWAAGVAASALPGAVATAAVAHGAPTRTVLALGSLAVCLPLACAALLLVERHELRLPLALGPALGAAAVMAAAFTFQGPTDPDTWLTVLLAAAAVLLFVAPSIGVSGRADRRYTGPDLAAAAVTVALLATLVRVASLFAPGDEVLVAAVFVLLVAAGVRGLPAGWRPGPALGTAVGGAAVAAIAGYEALRGGLRVLAAPGPLWHGDLGTWPSTAAPDGWQAPLALILLAVAAAVALPRPYGYDAAAVCVGLATVGVPVAFGLPWWSPILVDGAVAAAYGAAATVAVDPRAARARAAVAAAVSLHAVGAGLVRPWTTAAALALVALIGAVVATGSRTLPRLLDRTPEPGPDDTLADITHPNGRLPRHLVQIGGVATAATLVAVAGAAAATAAGFGHPAHVMLTGSLTATSLALALLAVGAARIPEYLPYVTVGVVAATTTTAIAALPTPYPAGLYAAAAVLLAVVAEVLREHTSAAGHEHPPVSGREDMDGHPAWTPGAAGVGAAGVGAAGAAGPVPPRVGRPDRPRPRGPLLRQHVDDLVGRPGWTMRPATGALVAGMLPTALAAALIAPALIAALASPFATLDRVWQGPPGVLVDPPTGAGSAAVLAALVLTVAATIAAIGFGGRHPMRAFPVVLPGLAATLLIAPVGLRLEWPAVTLAALTVFTLCMLGVALTPPPPATGQTRPPRTTGQTGPPRASQRARPLRATRQAAFVIGLAAGGAGLAGSLATRQLTLFTLAGAIGVGLAAGLGGRTATARVLGWPFAAVFAQLLVLVAGLVAGLDVHWSAFGVLAVGALLMSAGAMPRLRRPAVVRELAAIEWSGYAAGLLALALVSDSWPHVAAVLAGWGAVLGMAAARPDRRSGERRLLFWLAVAAEITAWWIFMVVSEVALPEAYTLPFAALALLVGVLELRQRPDMLSWLAFGPALLAAFVPTMVIVLTRGDQGLRQVLLLCGAVATVVVGAMRRQRAPVVIGAVVTTVTALHALTQVGPWLVLIPVGLLLLAFGANSEKNRRDLQRLRGALNRMR